MAVLPMLALLAALVTPLMYVPSVATAGDVPLAQDGKRKINLSGRQRMLSQRMAKAVCFAAMGIDTQRHLDTAADAHALFDVTLKALRQGNTELGMNPEKNPRILEQLAGVEALWSEYGPAVAGATTHSEAATAALPTVAALNMPVLLQMNTTVGAFERHYGSGGDIHPALALALNVSGRQRMLSQKASKEFCLVAAGDETADHRAALSETVALFDTSLKALINGSPEAGLPEAPTDEILAQLNLVAGLWDELEPIFEKVVSGQTPTTKDIVQVARDNTPLLTEMNRAVWMYDQL